MSIPVRQNIAMAKYLVKQKLSKKEKFPLLLELEPLFSCNLSCPGCGKIQHPIETMRKRLSVDEAVAAVEECGSPMVSIAGGEPLLHPEIDQIVKALVQRKKFVYLCTNAILLPRKIDRFFPSPYFSWAIHVDGIGKRHDEAVDREGVFDKVVEAVKLAKSRGFRVTTNSTFFTHDTPDSVKRVLDFLNDELQVDAMMISPAYAYEKAPDQDHFLGVRQARELFSQVFSNGNRKHWRLNHTPLFLDFLEGKADFDCTAWGIPCYSVLGWQKPCYLMGDGYASSYQELIETTDWDRYGRGKDPRCDNCLAHCGYEPTAVLATTGSLKQSLRALVGTH
jgi:hopanoid biosynthesis associated radical SAM protein HpnH